MFKKVVAGLMALVCVSSLNISQFGSELMVMEVSAETVYLTRDPFYNFGSGYNYYETEHFQFIWGNSGESSVITEEFLTKNGENMEACWDVYMNELGMEAPSQSVNTSLRDGNNYKVNIYISGTGLSGMEDDWAYMSYDKDGYAYMFCCTGSMLYNPPSWVLPHEFGHVVTAHQLGWNENKYSYAWWEAMGNWFREQYLYSDYSTDETGYGTDFFETYLKNMSLTSPCGRDYYSSWALLQYLTENPDNLSGYGAEFVKTMLQEGNTDEYPLKMIDRMADADLKETLGNYSKRLATLDFENQESYRARLDELLSNGSWNYQNIYTLLDKSEIEGWYRVPTEKAPQQAGVNVIPLEITGSSISVTLKGLTNVAGADWRACIVAEDASGNSYYSDLFASGETQTLSLPSGVKSAYLTVTATPDTDILVECGLPYGPDSEFAEENVPFSSKTQYPYEVKIEGADIKQRIVSESSNWWESYHTHSNGGGLVSDNATVDASVYVGANAKVLGNAKVTGNVVIDDYAVVEGSATVSDNVTIDGNAIISENAVLSGNAYVGDNAMVMGTANISGNAKIIESALVYGAYTVSDNAVIKGMAYCLANGSANGQGMADGDYYDDGGKSIANGTAYGWVSSQSYVNGLSYTDGGYAKYEFSSDSSNIVNDTYTSTYGVSVNSPTWSSSKTSADGVLSFDETSYVAFDRSLAYFKDVEYQTAILWKGDNEEKIFTFGDSKNYMNLTVNSDGSVQFNISAGTKTERLKSDTALEKGVWYTIELTLLDDTATLTLSDGKENTVSGEITLNPMDVAAATESDSFIFGDFSGYADYLRVSYKDSANDNTYYYTESEEVSEVTTTQETTAATEDSTTSESVTTDISVSESTPDETTEVSTSLPTQTTVTTEDIITETSSISESESETVSEESTTTASAKSLKGDVNCDGKVSTLDIIMMKNHLLEAITLEGQSFDNGDMNSDGSIKSVDLIMLKKYILEN